MRNKAKASYNDSDGDSLAPERAPEADARTTKYVTAPRLIDVDESALAS